LVEELKILPTNNIFPNKSNKLDLSVLQKQRHRLNIHHGDILQNIEEMVSEIKNSNETALVICNHVTTSQKVYEIIVHEFKLEAKLLHARFNSEDRFIIEKEILCKNPPRILISTQAVEVSLNLDYERGYTEPAPIDALVQRFGRINRAGSRPPASITVFETPSLKTSIGIPMFKPYDKAIIEKTMKSLPTDDVLSEERLVNIINEVYGNEYLGESKEEFERGLRNSIINNFNENIIAGSYRPWVEDIIEEQQEEVLPFSLLERYDEYRKQRRYLESNQLLVPIRCGQKWKMLKDKTMFFDKERQLWTTNLKYSNNTGLSMNTTETNLFLFSVIHRYTY